jgi:hypothetical protein
MVVLEYITGVYIDGLTDFKTNPVGTYETIDPETEDLLTYNGSPFTYTSGVFTRASNANEHPASVLSFNINASDGKFGTIVADISETDSWIIVVNAKDAEDIFDSPLDYQESFNGLYDVDSTMRMHTVTQTDINVCLIYLGSAENTISNLIRVKERLSYTKETINIISSNFEVPYGFQMSGNDRVDQRATNMAYLTDPSNDTIKYYCIRKFENEGDKFVSTNGVIPN